MENCRSLNLDARINVVCLFMGMRMSHVAYLVRLLLQLLAACLILLVVVGNRREWTSFQPYLLRGYSSRRIVPQTGNDTKQRMPCCILRNPCQRLPCCIVRQSSLARGYELQTPDESRGGRRPSREPPCCILIPVGKNSF